MQLRSFLAFGCVCFLLAPLFAADKKAPEPGQRETTAKPMAEKERKRKEEKLRKELKSTWAIWLTHDVGYIISDEERQAFTGLNNDEERQQFVEQFWRRRDPTPDTEENEFKEEHYRRMAYANERFASGIPGWKTDRGRIYITHGAPDEIEPHPSGGTYQRPIEEGGGTTSTYPFETWRYRHIDGIGSDIVIEFVDPTMTGEYRMTMDPSEKDALLHVPGAGPTVREQTGLASPLPERMSRFSRLEQFAKLQKPPAAKFPDLEATVTSNIRYNLLPMKVRTDFIPVTPNSIFSNITLQFEREDLQFSRKEGVATATVNLYARISTMSRRTVNVFEDVISVPVPAEMLGQAITGASVYRKTVPLAPGKYRLNIVAKDLAGGNMTTYEAALDVPGFDEETLSASSVILADKIERVSTNSIGTGPFVIGGYKVRPRLSESFSKDEKLGIFVQLYNFEPDEKTHKPDGTIEYEITNGANEKVFAFSESLDRFHGSAAQVTVENLLPLKSFVPGAYTLRMKVTDRKRNRTITPSARFTIL